MHILSISFFGSAVESVPDHHHHLDDHHGEGDGEQIPADEVVVKVAVGAKASNELEVDPAHSASV